MIIKKLSNYFEVLLIIMSVFFLNTEVKAVEYKEYTIGQEIRFNPITGEYCRSGNNCKTFNVINTGGNSEYYEMQLNYNLIANSEWGNTTDGPTIAVAELKEATKNWKGIETYTSDDNIELPSSSGTYIVNYNGSKARMIAAEEVAAIYNYETVGGSTWTWNGTSPSNNIGFDSSVGGWLSQNLDDEVYSNTLYFGHVYDDVEVESGHYPFDYFTSSATGMNGFAYAVEHMVVALEAVKLDFDNGNYDTGLRPIVKLKKQVQGSTGIQPKEVVIKGPKVIPGNTIPELDELEIPYELKIDIDLYFWGEKCGESNYKEVLPGEKFVEGCSYELLLGFDTNDSNNKNNKNVDITSEDIIFKYNDTISYESGYTYNMHLTDAKFNFENIQEEVIDDNNETVSEGTSNPKTGDSIYNSIALLVISTISLNALVVRKIKTSN